jgi:hypothetical protein
MNYRRTTQPFFAIAAAAVSLVPSAPAQSKVCTWPELKASPLNLDFSQGKVGSAPGAWLLGPESFMPPHVPVYEALIAPPYECHGSPQCATVHSLRNSPSSPLSFLYQDLDASPYRGQTLIYRAFVRVAGVKGVLRGCWYGFIGRIARRRSAMTSETIPWCPRYGARTKSWLR